MPRARRSLVHESTGSYHIISRIPDSTAWLADEEKEHLVRLLARFCRGFFVELHAFCVMSNHFHLLVTGRAEAARAASEDELWRRYRAMHGASAEPPVGRQEPDGEVIPDPDGGVARLRARLGTVSRFVQELKQAFSRWYNARHSRKGYLWGDRWKGVLVSKAGDAEVVTAAYIDLNPVRAKMVRVPEDYRWSSAGLRVRSAKRAAHLLVPLQHPDVMRHGEAWYRQFMYVAGAVVAPGKPGRLSEAARDAVVARAGALGVAAQLAYRWRNLSEGVALGTAEFVATIQRAAKRKFVRPRPVWTPEPPSDAAAGGAGRSPPAALCATRVLRAVREPTITATPAR